MAKCLGNVQGCIVWVVSECGGVLVSGRGFSLIVFNAGCWGALIREAMMVRGQGKCG